jgi:ketosteroid isomerase-like protein
MRAWIAGAVAAALVVAGCGTDERSQVIAKVKQFASAAAAHDYATICDDVLAPALLADMTRGGIRCTEAMQIAFSHVHSPRLTVGNVSVTGSTATALTVSQAAGQKTALTTLQLVRTSSGWRIASLGAPVGS